MKLVYFFTTTSLIFFILDERPLLTKSRNFVPSHSFSWSNVAILAGDTLLVICSILTSLLIMLLVWLCEGSHILTSSFWNFFKAFIVFRTFLLFFSSFFPLYAFAYFFFYLLKNFLKPLNIKDSKLYRSASFVFWYSTPIKSTIVSAFAFVRNYTLLWYSTICCAIPLQSLIPHP